MLGRLLEVAAGLAVGVGAALFLGKWDSATCPKCQAGAKLIDEEKLVEPPPLRPRADAFGVLGFLVGLPLLILAFLPAVANAGVLASLASLALGAGACWGGIVYGERTDRLAEAARQARIVYSPNHCRQCGLEWGSRTPVASDSLERELADAKAFIERDCHEQALRQLHTVQRMMEANRFPADAAWSGTMKYLAGYCLLQLERHSEARELLEQARRLLGEGQERDKAFELLCYLDDHLQPRPPRIDFLKAKKDLLEFGVSSLSRVVRAVTPASDRGDGSAGEQATLR